jgi:hypothetical protein
MDEAQKKEYLLEQAAKALVETPDGSQAATPNAVDEEEEYY